MHSSLLPAVLGDSHQVYRRRAQCTRGLRAAFFAGASNIWGAMRVLARGEQDRTLPVVGYSALMVQACREAQAEALLILTTHEGPAREHFVIDGLSVTVERCEDAFAGKRGLAFHAASLRAVLGMRRPIAAFAANVVVATDEIPRALALSVLQFPGRALVRVHHCGLSPAGSRRPWFQRMLLALDAVVMRRRFSALLSASARGSAASCTWSVVDCLASSICMSASCPDYPS